MAKNELARFMEARKGKETPPVSQSEKTAKSQDKAYIQTSVYIREKTHIQAKAELLKEPRETRRDFSELVEDLLKAWLAART